MIKEWDIRNASKKRAARPQDPNRLKNFNSGIVKEIVPAGPELENLIRANSKVIAEELGAVPGLGQHLRNETIDMLVNNMERVSRNVFCILEHEEATADELQGIYEICMFFNVMFGGNARLAAQRIEAKAEAGDPAFINLKNARDQWAIESKAAMNYTKKRNAKAEEQKTEGVKADD